MAKKFPAQPKNPERICWGCDQYCAADAMRCGNGSDRTQHPVELFGPDWQDWGPQDDTEPADAGDAPQAHPSKPDDTPHPD